MNSKQSSATSAEEAEQSIGTFHASTQSPSVRLNDPLVEPVSGTSWYVAQTDKGRLLKIIIAEHNGNILVKSAYAPLYNECRARREDD